MIYYPIYFSKFKKKIKLASYLDLTLFNNCFSQNYNFHEQQNFIICKRSNKYYMFVYLVQDYVEIIFN